jgi:hypothetical protein
VVSDGYVSAIGVPYVPVAPSPERDTPTSEPVVLVNEPLARIRWAGQDPIGQIMAFDGGRRVVGLVADVRHRALEDTSGPEIYLPIRQTSYYSAVYMVVRANLSPAAGAAAIREALRPIEPDIPGNEFLALHGLIDRAVSPRRFVVLLLSGFSAFALILAAM